MSMTNAMAAFERSPATRVCREGHSYAWVLELVGEPSGVAAMRNATPPDEPRADQRSDGSLRPPTPDPGVPRGPTGSQQPLSGTSTRRPHYAGGRVCRYRVLSPEIRGGAGAADPHRRRRHRGGRTAAGRAP